MAGYLTPYGAKLLRTGHTAQADEGTSEDPVVWIGEGSYLDPDPELVPHSRDEEAERSLGIYWQGGNRNYGRTMGWEPAYGGYRNRR